MGKIFGCLSIVSLLRKGYTWMAICLLMLMIGCSNSGQHQQEDPVQMSWEEIVEKARGETVTLMMWRGDKNINDYMQGYVKRKLREKFDVTLEIVSGQGSTIVSILMKELEAGNTPSELDMMWINGETFYQLREIDALFGPFVQKLPNARFLDLDNPFIKYDFQQEIDGYECPWGNVQFTMIYDTARINEPPRSMDELKRYVKRHPGTFTISNDFTGMTFLKSLLIGMAGEEKLQGEFKPEVYQTYSSRLWAYINRIKSHFWKSGKTFPSGVSRLHQLYADGELYITMSNNDAEAANKVREGLFPRSTRGYVLKSGTIRNSHYMGIARHSGSKAAAMVTANFLISPEAQYRKMKPKIWGDGTVLALEKLSDKWRKRFEKVQDREYAPSREEIDEFALQELAPKYMVKLYEDFRQEVIQRQ